MASGHPFAPVSKVWPGVNYADPPFLFLGDGPRFTNVAPEAGEALRRPHAGRGVAVGDFDNDGDPTCSCCAWGSRRGCSGTTPPTATTGSGCSSWARAAGRDAIGARVTADRGRPGADAGARGRRKLPDGVGPAAAVRARPGDAGGRARGALAERPRRELPGSADRPLHDAARGRGLRRAAGPR